MAQYENPNYEKSDVQLILMYRNNNQDAVTQLINRYTPLVYNICKTYFNFIEKEDILQEAYIGLLRAIITFDEEKNASFNTYANVCVKNKVKNFLISTQTKKSLFTKSTLSLDELQQEDNVILNSLNQYKDNPEKIVIKKEEYSFLMDTIDNTLSELEKDILFLYLNGFSNKDICSRLSISNKQVDNALHRAKVKLKNFLGKSN